VSDALAIAAACIFVFLASYRIKLPGLYMDELDFAYAVGIGAVFYHAWVKSKNRTPPNHGLLSSH
jgi:hypothetical protein